jgi:hypothetical protein
MGFFAPSPGVLLVHIVARNAGPKIFGLDAEGAA